MVFKHKTFFKGKKMKKTLKQLLLTSALVAFASVGTTQVQAQPQAAPQAQPQAETPSTNDTAPAKPKSNVILKAKPLSNITVTVTRGGKGKAGNNAKKTTRAKPPVVTAATPPVVAATPPTPVEDNQNLKDGFYIAPNAEIIFLDKAFTRGLAKVGVGGGGGASIGYRISNFAIDLAFDYQAFNSNGEVHQQTSVSGARWLAVNYALTNGLDPTAAFNNAANSQPIDVTNTFVNKEAFIPLTLGLKYSIPLAKNDVVTLTPGIAGGVWFHTVDRFIESVIYQPGLIYGAWGNQGYEKQTETKGVIVPSLAIDYNPTPNVSISLAGKFYIVPNGYSDNYDALTRDRNAQFAVNRPNFEPVTSFTKGRMRVNGKLLPLGLTPAYTAVGQTLWYGGINLAVQYTF